MATILEKIVEQTREDLERRRRKVHRSDFQSFESYERERRDFGAALRKEGSVSVIAEIKKASPSKGEIRPDFHPRKIAEQYQQGGASAISVLTDEPFFKGKLEYLEAVSRTVAIPVLRKDFIIDPYQVEEARAYGADAILLIATVTEGQQLSELLHAAAEAGLQCLVECYDEEDFRQVDFGQVNILGVNNRDLHTFEVNLHRGIKLLNRAPEDVICISESGIHKAEDLAELYQNGIHAALIGEYFMRQSDPGAAVKQLLETFQEIKKL